MPRHAPGPHATRHAPTGAGVVLLNKPYGVLCQFTRRRRRPTLKDSSTCPDVYPAGRLDADSEGLVVLTADGALQARIADPRHKLPKTYWVQVEGDADGARNSRRCARRRRSATVRTRPARARASREPPALWPRDPPMRVRSAIPTAWLEIALARRPQPPGAADDRGGRPADAAADPLVGRAVDARRARARRMARGRRRRSRVLTSAPRPPIRRIRPRARCSSARASAPLPR